MDELQKAHRIREINHFDLCIPVGEDGGEKGEERKEHNFCREQGNFSFGLEISWEYRHYGKKPSDFGETSS